MQYQVHRLDFVFQPLEEVVEQQRQQQARLSNLLQQRNAAATSIRTATGEKWRLSFSTNGKCYLLTGC